MPFIKFWRESATMERFHFYWDDDKEAFCLTEDDWKALQRHWKALFDANEIHLSDGQVIHVPIVNIKKSDAIYSDTFGEIEINCEIIPVIKFVRIVVAKSGKNAGKPERWATKYWVPA